MRCQIDYDDRIEYFRHDGILSLCYSSNVEINEFKPSKADLLQKIVFDNNYLFIF